MLGYLTAKEALAEGFTHHGSYYGIPLWITDCDHSPMVAAKWAPMEFVMDIAHFVEQSLFPLLHPGEEPRFMFQIREPIDGPE